MKTTVRQTVVLVVKDNTPDDHRLVGLRQRHQPVYIKAMPHAEGDGLNVVQGTEEGGDLGLLRRGGHGVVGGGQRRGNRRRCSGVGVCPTSNGSGDCGGRGQQR